MIPQIHCERKMLTVGAMNLKQYICGLLHQMYFFYVNILHSRDKFVSHYKMKPKCCIRVAMFCAGTIGNFKLELLSIIYAII